MIRSIFVLLLLPIVIWSVGTAFAQEDKSDLAIVEINRYVDKIPTGTVYIFDQNYSLVRILESPEAPTLGQFDGDVTFHDGNLILSTPSRENKHNAIPMPSDPLNRIGAISIFDGVTGSLIKTIWNPEPNTRAEYPGGTFGSSIAFAGDSMIVGNTARDINGMRAAGAVYVLDGDGNVQLTINNPDPNTAANFGSALATWGDNVVVGVPGKNAGNADHSGAVSILDPSTGSILKTIVNPNPSPYAAFGSPLDVAGDKLLVAAPTASVDDEENVGAVYLYNANTSELIKTIENPDPDEDDLFGRSVLFAGDRIVIGAVGDGVLHEGSVYIYDGSGNLQKTIHSPQSTAKEGLYSNDFGVTLASKGNLLVIGDYDKLVNGTRAGGAYVYDIESGNLVIAIDNPRPDQAGAFGGYVGFVGDMEPSDDVLPKIVKEPAGSQENIADAWVDPQRYTVSGFVGTLEYDKIPDGFECDNTPKVTYQYVNKTLHPQYPDHDSLLVRIGGKDAVQDFEIGFSLWNNNSKAYAKDLSQDIILKRHNGTTIMGAIYSPDAYSDYSTLGVMVEANNKVGNNGILPEDARKRISDLFGSSSVVPAGVPASGSYDLYVRVFDSEDDWVSHDTCGIQAVIPISASGEDSVTVGKIQFSNIKVSAIETNNENLELAKKRIADAANGHAVKSIRWMHENGADYSVGGIGILRLDDSDLNVNKELIDIPAVLAWSDTDQDGIKVDMIETGTDTGVFYADVSLSGTESAHLQLHVSGGDVISASYEDESLDEPLVDTAEINSYYVPPLQQLDSGVSSDEVQCREGLELAMNPRSGDPMCLTPTTVSKLKERHWL